MNTYEKHANLYSAWAAMLVPTTLIAYSLYVMLQFKCRDFLLIKGVLSTILPVVFFSACGYYLRELFRDTSKILFQFQLFKEDETEMPTTKLLLYKSRLMDRADLSLVRRRVKEDFSYRMPSEKDEDKDLLSAKIGIASAVSKIREVTRSNMILLQANYRYGFYRNMLGGIVWAVLPILVIIGLGYGLPNKRIIMAGWVSFSVLMLQFALSLLFMKYAAWTYARYLIAAYLTRDNK